MPMQFLVVKVIFLYGFVFTELVSQIDQKINKLVAEQQKVDAQCAHNRSEIEELKQDIANSDKQKELFSKALGKKVSLNLSDYTQLSLRSFVSIGSCL
jgi:predicted PurR-regulated permease PerM